MQRIAILGLVLMVWASGVACIAVKDVKVNSGQRYPVAVNNEIYLVDVDNATACKVPTSNTVCAPVSHCQDHDHDHDHD